tara:strand:+ start:127 stop:414 length:288 start_codon:yes stop_codon:yes gene_type:complete
MKKVILSVAALTIANVCFSTEPKSNDRLVFEIMEETQHIMEWIREDEWNQRVMTKELAETYINALLNIYSRAEDIKVERNFKRNVIDCENCDEID